VLPTIKPLDKEFILEKSQDKKLSVTIEDGVMYGGFGSAVSGICEVLIKAYPDKSIPHGTVAELDRLFGMDSETIAREIEENLNER